MNTFELLFFPKGPDGPFAHIQIGSSTAFDYSGKRYEDVISCDCTSPAQLDAEIERLQRELEAIRKKGKARFSNAA